MVPNGDGNYKGIATFLDTLSEHLNKMYVLVDKPHEDQKVTKGRVAWLGFCLCLAPLRLFFTLKNSPVLND